MSLHMSQLEEGAEIAVCLPQQEAFPALKEDGALDITIIKTTGDKVPFFGACTLWVACRIPYLNRKVRAQARVHSPGSF